MFGKLKKCFGIFLLLFVIAISPVVLAGCDKDKEEKPVSSVVLNATMVSFDDSEKTYNGEAFEPEVTVNVGSVVDENEYDVTYENNINAGTASVIVTAKEDSKIISGSVTKTFSIKGCDIKSENITVVGEQAQYDGTSHVPTVTVKNPLNTEEDLVEDTDYSVTWTYKSPLDNSASSYTANEFINAGDYIVTISGKGNFKGTPSKTCIISQEQLNLTISMKNYSYGEETEDDLSFDGNEGDADLTFYTKTGTDSWVEFIPGTTKLKPATYSIKVVIDESVNYKRAEKVATEEFIVSKGTRKVNVQSVGGVNNIISLNENETYANFYIVKDTDEILINSAKGESLTDKKQLTSTQINDFCADNSINPGSYYIFAKIDADDYYNECQTNSISWVVKGDVSDTFKIYDASGVKITYGTTITRAVLPFVYDAREQSIIDVLDSDWGDHTSVYVKKSEEVSEEYSEETAVGNYTLKINFSGFTYFNNFSREVEIKIEKATYTASLQVKDSGALVFGDNVASRLQVCSFSKEEAEELYNKNKLTVKFYSCDSDGENETEITNATKFLVGTGDYYFCAKISGATNFSDVSTGPVQFKISKRNLAEAGFKLSFFQSTYDGNTHHPDILSDYGKSSDYSASWSYKATKNSSESTANFTDVGIYTVTISASGEGNLCGDPIQLSFVIV